LNQRKSNHFLLDDYELKHMFLHFSVRVRPAKAPLLGFSQ